MVADLVMARQFVTMVAIGEMTHLRWGNQILWELCRAGLYPEGETYEPILTTLRGSHAVSGVTVPELRPMDLQALDNFARIERPGGPTDTAYARCVATLSQDHYPPSLRELAIRIDTDGTQHYGRFLEVRTALRAYHRAGDHQPAYLRRIRLGSPEETSRALDLLSKMLAWLHEAYLFEADRQFDRAQGSIDQARQGMQEFQAEAERLAAGGLGIPFFSTP
jgi:hypothetical protein